METQRFSVERLEQLLLLSATGDDGCLIEILAAGATGDENLSLQIDGVTVQTWESLGGNVSQREFELLTYQAENGITADRLRLVFDNDVFDPDNGINRDIVVDSIAIDGTVYQTEDPSTFSTGTWIEGVGVVPGNWQSETLHTNGYFQFAAPSSTDARATVRIDPFGNNIDASTYGGGFSIANESQGVQAIDRVVIDLSTAILPNVVFDPFGAAGDPAGLELTVQNEGGTGFASVNYLQSNNGGYDAIEVLFNDFNPGEQFTFAIDVDPTSIQGLSAPGPNESGSVSGLELSGATVDASFSDGSQLSSRTFYVDGSNDASVATLESGDPLAPTLSLNGSSNPSVVANANQTIRVTGQAGSQVALYVVEAGLFTSNFVSDPFEANSVIGIDPVRNVTIGNSGFADVSVNLSRSGNDSGLNHIFAAARAANGEFGAGSSALVVEFDPSNPPPPPPPQGSSIAVFASGAEGTEDLELRIDGVAVARFNDVGTSGQGFTYQADETITADRIQVAFVDAAFGGGVDENLIVDRIEIDGQVFETEAPTTFSTGTWNPGGVVPGYYESETLHVNGYFQYLADDPTPPPPPPQGSSIAVFASGAEGTEDLELRIDGVAVARFNDVGTSGQGFTYQADETITADRIQVAFVDAAFSGGVDENLIVDRIEIDGQVFETEAPTTFSTGTWNPGGVVPGYYESETLHVNGYFQYLADDPTPPPPPPQGSSIAVFASGAEGTEDLELRIDGVAVARFNDVGTSGQGFTYQADETITADRIQVAFVDAAFGGGVDENLIVDRIEIDGQVFETEAPTTFSTGTWNPGGVVPGYYESETLHVNGYFQYLQTPPPGDPGELSFSVSNASVNEGAGIVTVTVQRSGGSEGEVQVDYATNAGSASAGGDFVGANGTLVFADGVTEQQFTVQLVNDNIQESDESFTIQLSNPTGGATVGTGSQSIEIIDDDAVQPGPIYSEDFENSPSGWFVIDQASTGNWQIGNPQGTSFGGVTLQLGNTTSGSNALVTGLSAGSSAGTNDVDGGVTVIESPQVALPENVILELTLQYNFAHLDNATNADFLQITIVGENGQQVVLNERGTATDRSGSWTPLSADISQFAGQTIQIQVAASDASNGSLIEAAVDDIQISVV